MLVFTLHLKVDDKLTTVNEITNYKCQMEKIMTITEVIQEDG